MPSPCASSVSDEWNDDINLLTRQTHSNRGKFINQSTPTYLKIGQESAYSFSRSPVPPSCDDAIHSRQYKLSWLQQSIRKTPVHTLSTCMILAMPWAALIVFGQLNYTEPILDVVTLSPLFLAYRLDIHACALPLHDLNGILVIPSPISSIDSATIFCSSAWGCFGSFDLEMGPKKYVFTDCMLAHHFFWTPICLCQFILPEAP